MRVGRAITDALIEQRQRDLGRWIFGGWWKYGISSWQQFALARSNILTLPLQDELDRQLAAYQARLRRR